MMWARKWRSGVEGACRCLDCTSTVTAGRPGGRGKPLVSASSCSGRPPTAIPRGPIRSFPVPSKTPISPHHHLPKPHPHPYPPPPNRRNSSHATTGPSSARASAEKLQRLRSNLCKSTPTPTWPRHRANSPPCHNPSPPALPSRLALTGAHAANPVPSCPRAASLLRRKCLHPERSQARAQKALPSSRKHVFIDSFSARRSLVADLQSRSSAGIGRRRSRA
jgi:hypothetical protein